MCKKVAEIGQNRKESSKLAFFVVHHITTIMNVVAANKIAYSILALAV